MTTAMSEEQIYKQAEKRVAARTGFYIHLAVYVCVNILLFLIWWFVTGAGFPWFIFPIVVWGIGIIFHALGAFVFGKKDSAAVEKEAERIRREQQ